MYKIPYSGRIFTKQFSKGLGGCIFYSQVALRYAEKLESDVDVKMFRCLVPLENLQIIIRAPSLESYVSDFLVYTNKGGFFVRECVQGSRLGPHQKKILALSKLYWNKMGVNDWGIVTEVSAECRTDFSSLPMETL